MIDPFLENIVIAHYTVLYHLGAATELGTKSGQQFCEGE
jgi:hypothetical protein